jgi:hypothetical protein
MTLKITELGGGMARAGLTTKDTNDTKGGEACGHGMTLKITELGGRMARVGLPANHANITNHESLDPGVFGARRFKHEDRRGRSLGAGTSYWCGDDD